MADSLDKTPEQEPETGSEALDQSSIDSLFGGTANTPVTPRAPQAETPAKPENGSEAFDQSSIDSLFGGTANTPVAPRAPQAETPADPQPGVQEINQADIDALLGAAGLSAASHAGDADLPPSVTTVAQASSAEDVPDGRLDSLGRPFDEAAAAMQAAIEEERAAAARIAPPVANMPLEPPPILPVTPFTLPDLGPPPKLDIDPKRVTMLNDVNLRVRIELGRTRMLVEDVLKLGEGSVVELDKPAGDPVDVYVNDRLVARGEVLVLADNFCVRVSEVFSNDPHRISA